MRVAAVSGVGAPAGREGRGKRHAWGLTRRCEGVVVAVVEEVPISRREGSPSLNEGERGKLADAPLPPLFGKQDRAVAFLIELVL